MTALACSLALPLAAAGQTPPPAPPSVPVTHPTPAAPSLTLPSARYGTWQGDRFIPHPTLAQEGQPKTPDDKKLDHLLIQLDPPTHDQLFQLRGEQGLYNQIVADYRLLEGNKDATPPFPLMAKVVEPGVTYRMPDRPPASADLVPAYLCHQPLYFEEKNAERYGWEMGVWQPFISAGTFYKDLAFLPYKMGLDHPISCVTNLGKWQPGDCVPYILYVTPFTWKGAALESGTIIGGGAIWP